MKNQAVVDKTAETQDGFVLIFPKNIVKYCGKTFHYHNSKPMKRFVFGMKKDEAFFMFIDLHYQEE